jgi:hypothetical protein
MRIWLASTVLALLSQGASAGFVAAQTVDGGSRLMVTRDDGSQFSAPAFSDQVGFEQPRISPDGRSVGWLALYRNCCTSYPIALKLVILDEARRLRTFEGIELAIFKWCFLPRSRSVAYMQTVLHGSDFEHFEARSISSGELMAQYEFPADELKNAAARRNAPSWVRCVER